MVASAPCVSNQAAMSFNPEELARCSGVWPSRSRALRSAPRAASQKNGDDIGGPWPRCGRVKQGFPTWPARAEAGIVIQQQRDDFRRVRGAIQWNTASLIGGIWVDAFVQQEFHHRTVSGLDGCVQRGAGAGLEREVGAMRQE
jgi:hypothetical protein